MGIIQKVLILKNFKETKMKETIKVEIRAAEGGQDAKLLVIDQYDIYRKYCDMESL